MVVYFIQPVTFFILILIPIENQPHSSLLFNFLKEILDSVISRKDAKVINIGNKTLLHR